MTVGSHRRTRLALLLLPVLVFSACGSGDDVGGGGEPTSACKPSDGPVSLTMWSFEPSAREAVDLWNKTHSDITVELKEVPGGLEGTYQKYTNAIKAGSGLPDIGMVEFDTLPVYRLQDALVDMAQCGAAKARDEFVDSVLPQVGLGDPDAMYGSPIDLGPMAMYYRADLFKKYGIDVPKTWEEYAEVARTVHEQEEDVYLTNVSSFSGGNWFTSLAWQSGAHWFDIEEDTWTVDMTDDATMHVADYWQGLIDGGVVSDVQNFTESWNRALADGTILTHLGAAWSGELIELGAPGTEGKWRVAPLPQWESGASQSANWGGSAYSVFTQSEHPYEATQVALWMNTDPEALARLSKGAYPAAIAGLGLPQVTDPKEFYGGQEINDVFQTASENIDESWVWGPVMTTTYSSLADGVGQVLAGQENLADAFASAEEETIEDMEAQGLQVEQD